MTHVQTSSVRFTAMPARLLAALALTAALSACGGHAPVRPGPQAVHPSPSAFAQSTQTSATPCGSQGAPACHVPNPADGSAPIID